MDAALDHRVRVERAVLIRAIVLHHSVSSPSTTLAQIDGWHKVRGFRCVGYQYVIRLEGEAAIIERGRSEDERGAHLKPSGLAEINNSNSIGVCIAGQHQSTAPHAAPPDRRLLTQAVELTAELCDHYGLTEEDVFGHRELRPTACPGDLLDLDEFRECVGSLLEQIRAASNCDY